MLSGLLDPKCGVATLMYTVGFKRDSSPTVNHSPEIVTTLLKKGYVQAEQNSQKMIYRENEWMYLMNP